MKPLRNPGSSRQGIPDFAEFTLGYAKGVTRGLHPGYSSVNINKDTGEIDATA